MSCDQETYDAIYNVVATQYGVYCENKDCKTFTHILAPNLKAAKQQTYRLGWRTYKRQLHCPECAAKLKLSKQRVNV